jgi:glucose/arabinose dehydrogenase
MRNPIALRCQHGKNRCFAIELSRDYSATMGGREKLVPLREGDDWGFPCCATKNVPYPDVAPTPDCSSIASENNSFVIGDTPFGLDFAPSTWPGRWAGNVLVTLHGQFGSWTGAKVVAIATDPATGEPIPSGIVSQDANSGAVTTFAAGWDDGTKTHGRPSDAAFAPDGRLFIANDVDGEIFWIAPITDPVPSRGADRDASVGAGGADPGSASP